MKPENTLVSGDCVARMRELAEHGAQVHAVITDPPYGLSDHSPQDVAKCLMAWARGEEYRPKASGGFMGRSWDAWVPGPEVWREAYNLLPPGGHLLCFASTRTADLMGIAIRLAGFEIRDTVSWMYGAGFPKSLDVSKQLDQQEKNAWLNVAKAIDNLAASDIMAAWISHSNAATPAAITFRKSPTEAGQATDASGSAPASVLLSANPASSLASATLAELASSAAPPTFAGTSASAPSSAESGTTELSALVTIAAGPRESREATLDTTASFAPWLASASLAASTSHMEAAVEALRIWLGSDLSSKPAATAALCAALTDALKHITLSQSAIFRSFDTKSQTDCASAITATTTESTAASLISFTAATLKSRALDKMAGAEREVIGTKSERRTEESSWAGNLARGIFRPGEREYDITAPATEAAREWAGWGTGLKPSHEPIIVARKPLDGTVAGNVLRHGVGGLDIDGCRIPISDADKAAINAKHAGMDAEAYRRPAGVSLNMSVNPMALKPAEAHALGRWPANAIHDGSEEVEAAFAAFGERPGGKFPKQRTPNAIYGGGKGASLTQKGGARAMCDTGTASRFFYSAKAGGADRVVQCLACGVRSYGKPPCGCPEGSGRRIHPTTKPLSLMRYLVRLVTPPGGVVLDPFMGSGTTIAAAALEGFHAIGIELDPEHFGDAMFRLENLPEPAKEAKPRRMRTADRHRAIIRGETKAPKGNPLLEGWGLFAAGLEGGKDAAD